ncbi:histidine phosphatase superfamily [Corynascus novoguineensis]|uniref:Histidine phosphatase superfamily n=1 Tax=Corynascus novoguineensis TaxID=1126955 RepID=A0AAN7D0A5_9PEZI|nr:histidine phosphatase superfamily [Corynascus novoguineensis]
MGRPRLIILIRHAQSEGNKNRDIHQTIPDHRVKLTQDGWQQAYDAGRRLRALLREDDTLHFFTSPYRRTRETTEGILATLTSDEPEPSPFKRDKIKVYEEPRLREQDFGNFQPCSAEMERMWQERADYGHFFYRIPNGESAADAYDRISGFNESLWRQFGEDDFASVCVLVTHGLMSRVFLMKWYHFSVEYFEDLRNVNHCEFLIMRRNNDNGKYILENKLRTWSELRRERARELAEGKGEEAKEDGKSKDVSTLARAGTVEVQRRWGGCPNGCNHDKSFRIRQTLADLVKSDSIISNHASGLAVNESGACSGSSSTSGSTAVPNGNGTAAGSTYGILNPSFNGTANSQTIVSRRPAAKRFQSQSTDETGDGSGGSATGPQIDVTKARDEVVSSPDGTPSFISVDDRLRSHLRSPNMPPRPLEYSRLHVGRDFGGTYSGHNSAGSDDADSGDDSDGRPGAKTLGVPASAIPHRPFVHHHHRHHHQREQSRMGRGTRANRLGDHQSSDGEHEADCEHEPGHHHEDDDEEHDGHGCDSNCGDDSPDKACAVLDGQGGSAVVVVAAHEMADEADDVLAREEEEDRSIRGSVY